HTPDRPGYLHPFPTRRSSDLVVGDARQLQGRVHRGEIVGRHQAEGALGPAQKVDQRRLRGNVDEVALAVKARAVPLDPGFYSKRSEEHTSELQSRFDLVCRLL